MNPTNLLKGVLPPKERVMSQIDNNYVITDSSIVVVSDVKLDCKISYDYIDTFDFDYEPIYRGELNFKNLTDFTKDYIEFTHNHLLAHNDEMLIKRDIDGRQLGGFIVNLSPKLVDILSKAKGRKGEVIEWEVGHCGGYISFKHKDVEVRAKTLSALKNQNFDYRLLATSKSEEFKVLNRTDEYVNLSGVNISTKYYDLVFSYWMSDTVYTDSDKSVKIIEGDDTILVMGMIV